MAKKKPKKILDIDQCNCGIKHTSMAHRLESHSDWCKLRVQEKSRWSRKYTDEQDLLKEFEKMLEDMP